ncbi:MAG: methionine--tRNA ligase, partial [Pseudarthrobacter sp.]|nr:methionine--tRNA ligase [Pseudarthrobacter sp.]
AYFAEQAPWVLRKTDIERMNTVLYVTLEVLRIVAILAQPVMPNATAKLLDALGQPEGDARQFAALGTPIRPGTALPAPAPVFPKFEEPAE